MELTNETRLRDFRLGRNMVRDGQTSEDSLARQVINEMSTSTWAFSVLACALETGLLEALSESRSLADLSYHSGLTAPLVEGILDVLVALGLILRNADGYSSTPDLLPLLQAPARNALLADIRSVYLQSRAMIDAAKRGGHLAGWSHTDPELLVAQGASGGPFFSMLTHTLFPRLDGLVERLQGPTGTFLDVGTGVGTIAIQMCQLFLRLRVVGLEPQDAPLAQAHRNVTTAKLEDRIELRAQRIEDLADREAFDLVWLPQAFLPREVLERRLPRAWAALRPGGWCPLIAFSTPGMNLDAALLRLATVAYGGDPLYPEQIAELLAATDFVRTQIVPGPPGSIPKLIVGQRPPS